MLEADPASGEVESNASGAARLDHDFSRISLRAAGLLGIQPKLAVSVPGDAYEQEADRVAERVMRMPEPKLQRTCACGGECPRCKSEVRDSATPLEAEASIQRKPAASREWQDVPRDSSENTASPQVDGGFENALNRESGRGRSLSSAARAFFEPRIGFSFEHVRIHEGPRASALCREINARAFTHGEHIYFAEGQHDTESTEGRRVMAHELTHTIQQRPAGPAALPDRGFAAKARQPALPSHTQGMRVQRTWEDVQTGNRLESYTDRAGAEAQMRRLQEQHPTLEYRIVERGSNFVIQSRAASTGTGTSATPPQICGRASTKVLGFPDPHISQIDIDLGNLASGLSITWSRNTAETRALPSSFPISPGAGLCTTCCDGRTASRTGGSLCTPKGNDFQVDGYRCQLSTATWATNATFFAANIRSGIAIHTGPLPGYPASHGCVRTTERGSSIIYDNSRSNGDTAVHVGGTWSGNRCYTSARASRARRRSGSELCGGSATGKTEQTETQAAQMEPVEAPVDGAGPA